jgi:phosphomannomutase/phosphoglucomutase
VAEAIGRAFPAELGVSGPHIVLGRDNRETSPAYRDAIAAGLQRAGCRVTDIGPVPTPLVWFYVAQLQGDGAVQVTASHKEPTYNGFKLRRGQKPFWGEEIQQGLYARVTQGPYAEGEGSVALADEGAVIERYLSAMAGACHLERALRVVVSTGYGIAGRTAPHLFRRLGCQVTALEADWRRGLPPKPLDPAVPEELSGLQEAVRRERADLGVAIDPDGDRLGIVNERGEVVPPDYSIIPLARQILARGPATFVFDVRCSDALRKEVEGRGGTAELSPCGYPNVLANMDKHGGALGAETTGHIFHQGLVEAFERVTVPYDDALFAACKLAECVAAAGPLSEQLADVPRYLSSPEYRVECPDDRKFGVVDEVREHLAGEYATIDIDGVRFALDDGWGLVRASNTGPELVVRYEARKEGTYRRLAEVLVQALGRFDCLDREKLQELQPDQP